MLVRHVGAPRRVEFGRLACYCYINDAMIGPSAWTCTTNLTGYEPGALLLSYGEKMNW